VESVVAVLPCDPLDDWLRVFAQPDLAVVTLTVTEAGYRARGEQSAPARLVAGLAVRRDAGLPPLTLVPCDNLPSNGAILRAAVLEVAGEADPGLADWIDGRCGFVTTLVDRITPRPDDPLCVVTEPYTEWVLSGEFVAGRPAWEAAGARFVDDLEPWERRKLWLLNGSHSLMAYAASIRGHETVADAIADPVVRDWVEQWWDDAARHLPLPADEIASYRAALLNRYENPRIRHLLAQIAADGSQKLPVRTLPVLAAELAEGRVARGATRAVAAWTLHLRGLGAPLTDPAAADLAERIAGAALPDAAAAVLDALGADDPRVLEAVVEQAKELDGHV